MTRLGQMMSLVGVVLVCAAIAAGVAWFLWFLLTGEPNR